VGRGIPGYTSRVSISALSPVGAAPLALYVPAPPPVATRSTLPIASPVSAPAPAAAPSAAPTSELTGDAGEVIQSNAAAVFANAMIAYPPIPIDPVKPTVTPVAPVVPAGFTPIDTYA